MCALKNSLKCFNLHEKILKMHKIFLKNATKARSFFTNQVICEHFKINCITFRNCTDISTMKLPKSDLYPQKKKSKTKISVGKSTKKKSKWRQNTPTRSRPDISKSRTKVTFDEGQNYLEQLPSERGVFIFRRLFPIRPSPINAHVAHAHRTFAFSRPPLHSPPFHPRFPPNFFPTRRPSSDRPGLGITPTPVRGCVKTLYTDVQK